MKILYLLEAVVSILLIASILLQQRGTSIGGAFGAESSVYRSLRGVEKFLFFATVVLGIAFGGTAIAILWLS